MSGHTTGSFTALAMRRSWTPADKRAILAEMAVPGTRTKCVCRLPGAAQEDPLVRLRQAYVRRTQGGSGLSLALRASGRDLEQPSEVGRRRAIQVSPLRHVHWNSNAHRSNSMKVGISRWERNGVSGNSNRDTDRLAHVSSNLQESA